MTNINITNFRKDIFSLVDNTIKYNEPVLINSKNGNVVMISEDEYRGLLETLYLESIPGMKDSIIEGMNTPIEDCIPASEIEW